MGEQPSASQDSRDEEDDEDEYEEAGGGNRLLGFMFGNVDGSGDLDVDYLDEDAKEHLAALADKLGSSLTDIDLSIRSSQTTADASEQDYDEKAEDAVDYEDIEEQYEGPEIQAISEEDHLLPKTEFFAAEVSLSTFQHRTSVFDEENYDEGEDFDEEYKAVDNGSTAQTLSSAGILALEHSSEQPCELAFERDLEFSLEKVENSGLVSEEERSPESTVPSLEPFEAESLAVDLEDFQEEDEPQDLEESFTEKSMTSLPILCIEDGMVVLRFSEIFGIHEPVRKGEKRNHRYPIPKERLDASDIVEDDEEAFLRGSCQSFSTSKQVSITQYDDAIIKDIDGESTMFGARQGISMSSTEAFEQRKVTCLSDQPMKETVSIDLASGWGSPSCPKFYPLDQQDWEGEIIWDNSPLVSCESSETSTISRDDYEGFTNMEVEVGTDPRNLSLEVQVEPEEKDHGLFLSSYPVLVEPLGSRKISDSSNLLLSETSHPQLLRLESRFKVDDSNDSEVQKESNTEHLRKDDCKRHFSKKLSLRNMHMLDGSWLDNIIWEPNERISKPKLILDLQDEQMLFEILDNKDGGHLRLHAGAMIITRSAKLNGGDSFDLHGQGGTSVGRFNISNDKYYSNRKISQQLKSHSKKRAAHGVKVLHSIPALKLQTMKPKLSNKDIANFHRPKALWYPHDNEVAAKEQGKLSTQGPMKIILKSMGGKGSKLHVDAEEIVSSVKIKASKKLDFKPPEKVKIIYSGKELEDSKSLATQNVRPNSVLHLVRTKIHPWPRAQRLPGENKSLRPPGAFKKKSDLSVKDGHVFLMEYCEERPLLLGNVGMGARLCTYYQKSAPSDQTASALRNGSESLGTVIALDPADRSPFLGDIRPGCSQSCLETNMYRAPIFPHKLATTDYLLVRSAKGKISLRRIDRIHMVGQQEPHMEVISPGSKNLQTYIGNRLLVYMYRECRANEKRGLPPCIRVDELSAQFPSFSEPVIRKRLKHCADLQRGLNGQLLWVIRRNFRIPLEEELRRMVTPENVCSYESMQAGLYRLKRLGISRLTHPNGLSSAMNQLPDEAIALAASSHIERELQITPWNLTSNFVACTNQNRENIERLEITGVGDPSGRGLGFSYVRIAPKAPVSNVVKKKTAAPRPGGSTVTGTDADLRRLSMEGAREVLLKFNVPEEQIAKQTRWHRIAMIRKLSSEQASSGVKVDPTTIGKYARGQRMSFLQLQQQTREKCQEIWDRQLQSLSAADDDENESDYEANSDLDSFAGDLENLLDAEECGEPEVGNYESKQAKVDGVRGLKMRRHPTQAQAEEEIEDEAAEAAELCRMLMDDDEAERRKKKKAGAGGREEVGMSWQSGFGSESAERTKKTNTIVNQFIRTAQPDGSFTSKDNIIRDPKEVENILAKRFLSANIKSKKGNGMGLLKKKTKLMGDGFKVIKEKKHTDKPVREGFVCGACGQSGHMRTNKNCPRYGEDLDSQVESSGVEKISGKANFQDSSAQFQPKPMIKKIIPKIATKVLTVEAPESVEKVGLKTKILPLKLKYGPADKPLEQSTPVGPQYSDKQEESGNKSVSKISKLVISNKMKPEDVLIEPQKPSIVIRPPLDTERQKPRKKIVIKQPKGIINVDQVRQEVNYGMHEEHRKMKKMVELSSFEMQRKQEHKRFADEAAAKRKAKEERRFWEEEEKRRIAERIRLEKERLLFEQRRIQAEQQRIAESRRYNEAIQREREEQERQKAKKKKKMKLDTGDDYLEEHRGPRTNRRMPERNRAAKKRPVVESERFGPEYGQQTKRRRGGEGQVGLSNILDNILDGLKDAYEVSYLFLKPVSKKEAPDYSNIIKDPMDLSTIREKARRMEYKSRDEFRHDVWQITYNAHKYNDNRNPGIPPLADQLLELCDYLLDQNEERLNEAEAGIEAQT